MAARPWTTKDDARLQQLHGQGLSLHAIAEDLGRSKSTISRKAKQAGLVWDRATTKAATEAKVLDAKARRAAAVETELELLEQSQAQIREGLAGNGWKTIMRGGMGAESAETIDFVPARDLREHTAARSAMAGIITRLDTTDPGVEAGRSMLDALAASLGVHGPEPT